MDPLLAIATFLHGQPPLWVALLSLPLAVLAVYLPWNWYRRFLSVRPPPFLSVANLGTMLALATTVNLVVALLYESAMSLLLVPPHTPDWVIVVYEFPRIIGCGLTSQLADLTYLGLPFVAALGLLPFAVHILNVALRGLDPVGRQACRSIKWTIGLSAALSTLAWIGFFNAIYWANNTGVEKFNFC